jgi:hypothetical protein
MVALALHRRAGMAIRRGWSLGRSVRALRHELDELLERFEAPGTLRRELDRIVGDGLGEAASQRAPWWQRARPVAPQSRPAALLLYRLAQAMGLSGAAGASFGEDRELLSERPDSFVVRVDLHEMRERDIDVRLEGEVLTISGERHHEEAKREQGCACTERRYQSFSRSIELPRGVDSQRIEAHYGDGTLEVILPKRESLRTKQIPIVRHDARVAGDRYAVRRITPDGNGASHPQSTATS